MRAALAPLVLLAAAWLAGCAAVVPPRAPALADDPAPVVQVPTARARSGGVFTPASPWTLVADTRARRVGDVITVILSETTQASKRTGTQIDKGSSLGISPLTIDGDDITPPIGLSADRAFDGNASSTQQNALSGAITAVVVEVLPNGLLRIAGEKSLWLNQGEEFIRLSGYVRGQDVDAANRVSSQRIANARIAYSGSGTLADANTPGWLTRFFNSPWMPF
ncbi:MULTISPECIES: flagellar basal body L-ring protein FlgH [Hydrogenophaga]|uniref:Flagellar L-ring protein n=1 Tax=Hydrogenophaga intermedia TaxID=65786 RepID=A0A1L1PCH3_HYDIT|nr:MULTISPECIES: flagellar basal body L-ring protein FlgH [Hydrogenophaga]TMU78321.1 flagellar basal body L-ring protein FlgH [Hydrogenophaga intermedia]CDN87180.1 Basal body L-ring protein [Hydrogenophaga intermedia]